MVNNTTHIRIYPEDKPLFNKLKNKIKIFYGIKVETFLSDSDAMDILLDESNRLLLSIFLKKRIIESKGKVQIKRRILL